MPTNVWIFVKHVSTILFIVKKNKQQLAIGSNFIFSDNLQI